MSDEMLGSIGAVCIVLGIGLCFANVVLGGIVLAVGACIFGYFQGRNKKR
jgi:hypothetical protein